MLSVTYPKPVYKIKTEGEKESIFDSLRKKWVVLTPEEWVRQNFISYLIQVKNYPASLMAVEKEILLGELRKRFDILVYDKDHQPWMMVECKSMDVALDDSVVAQLLRYHISMPVPYLVITNGNSSYAWMKTSKGLEEINELPLP